MMTFKEFEESIYDGIEFYPINWRFGQKVFNYIDEKYNIARKVQYRDNIDCFYNDDNVNKFIEKAYKILNEEPCEESCKIFQVQKFIYGYGIVCIANYKLDLGFNIADVVGQIWHLCNFRCWSDSEASDSSKTIRDGEGVEIEPTTHFKGIANSDIIIQCPNGGYYVCKPIDWEWEQTYTEAVTNLMANKTLFMIPEETKKGLIQIAIDYENQ